MRDDMPPKHSGLSDTNRQARRSKRWSQTELGHRAGVSRPTIARIERGDPITTVTLAKVTTALGLTVRVHDNPH